MCIVKVLEPRLLQRGAMFAGVRIEQMSSQNCHRVLLYLVSFAGIQKKF